MTTTHDNNMTTTHDKYTMANQKHMTTHDTTHMTHMQTHLWAIGIKTICAAAHKANDYSIGRLPQRMIVGPRETARQGRLIQPPGKLIQPPGRLIPNHHS